MEIHLAKTAGRDLGELVDGAVEEAGDIDEEQRQVGPERDDELHVAVVGAGFGRDLRPAAVLGQVGDGEQDRRGKNLRRSAVAESRIAVLDRPEVSGIQESARLFAQGLLAGPEAVEPKAAAARGKR